MKIGFFVGEISNPKAGGGATFQNTILQGLMNTQSHHQFYVFYQNPEALFVDKNNIKFINLYSTIKKIRRKLFSTKTKKETIILDLGLEVKKNKIELLWFLTPNYIPTSAPFVLTVWDLEHRLQSYFPEVSLSGWTFDQRENFYKNAIPKAAYVVIGNEEGARQIEKFYSLPRERIKEIAFATPQFAFEKKADDSIITKHNLRKNGYLFYPAQFWPHKNHIRLLKALKILKQNPNPEIANLKLVFTGSDKGNQNYITRRTKELELENDVKFLGFVSEEELVALYQNAFALTFASMFGPDNIPPLEAMALKCPVICSNSKGMKLQLNDSAIFFNPLDENDLAAKIISMTDLDLRNNLTSKGEILAKELSVTKYIEKVFATIDEFSSYRECWDSNEPFIHL